MNNLLIVDDEPEILDWLDELFRYDFKRQVEVYTADSAFAALDILNEVKVDVVLSDIKMPGMDGIALYKAIKKNWPNCRVVFLSAYRSFDYMYELFSENTDIRYVLKSEEDNVIIDAVNRAFEEIDDLLRRRMAEEEQRILLEEAIQKVRQETLGRLIYPAAGKEVSQEQMDRAGLPLRLAFPVLAFLLRFDGPSSQNEDGRLLLQAASLIGKFAPDEVMFSVYMLNSRYAAVLAQPRQTGYINWKRIYAIIYGAMEYAQENFQKTYESSFSVIISSVETMTGELNHKIAWLREIAAGSLGNDEALIVHAEAIQPEKIPQAEIDINGYIEKMRQSLKLLKREEYFKELNICCAGLSRHASMHDLEALSLYYGAAAVILQFIDENKLNQKLPFEIGLYKLLELNEHSTWNEAGQYLFELSEKIFDIMGVTEDNLGSMALDRLVTYIDAHLYDDLTLTRLAEISGFNSSYLSRLFKKKKNMTISDYILEKRMDAAQRLLRTTNEKISEISVKTGYLSPHSFARTFRNYTGVSPQEYRERTLNLEK